MSPSQDFLQKSFTTRLINKKQYEKISLVSIAIIPQAIFLNLKLFKNRIIGSNRQFDLQH
ncbi:hypothetical protein BpHYR1_011381 [Brachionus plicatilis]|uniref:Uncharacterized protein n=1 Tax=Brachionus plicatilis TaxID=10195 RepID=A0A3M7T4V6_BRAPC|nr:hypothetical protein BpHYR1_011381 [Brachionus plicatilis]